MKRTGKMYTQKYIFLNGTGWRDMCEVGTE